MPALKDPRREKMAQRMFLGDSECQAYRRAGFKGKSKSEASKVANRPDIKGRTVIQRVAELGGKVSRRNILKKTEALEMLTVGVKTSFEIFRKAMRVNAGGIISLDPAVIKANPDLIHAIREVVNYENGKASTVRLHSFRELIETIAKLEGWEAPKDVRIRRGRLEDMPDDELNELIGEGGGDAGKGDD